MLDWRKLLRTAKPVRSYANLDRRHIYILPSRAGLLFAWILFGMLLGAINYSLSLGFVLTFTLAGLGVTAMLHTWRNLLNLKISYVHTEAVFAGSQLAYRLQIDEPDGRSRLAIGFRKGKTLLNTVDIIEDSTQIITLPLSPAARGWFSVGRLTAFTEFPLGLFHAWAYVEFPEKILIYPTPTTNNLPLPFAENEFSQGEQTSQIEGDDDFSGLRLYQQGDNLRRIDWKASARSQGWFTKQFEGSSRLSIWLDFDDLSSLNTEARLSQLTRWVLDAEAAGCEYGLKLEHLIIPPDCGDAHQKRCLEALACYP